MKCAGEAGSYRPDQQHPPSHTTHMDQQQAHRFTLAFKDNQIESNFKAWYDEAAAAHDQQAASIYLWMVALGSLLYVIVAAYSPGSRPANVDKCSLLILCSWLGPTAHLLLLRLLPRAVYVRNRTRILLLLRAFYIGATSVNGFGLCGVAPIQDKKATVVAALQMPLLQQQQQQQAAAAATAQGLGAGSPAHSTAAGGCSLESPFSALFWRSGVIGLNWWSAAFPLPFAYHIPVQAASVALYVNTLAHAVCSTMHGVRSGVVVLATIHHWAQALSSQLMAAVGAARPSTRYTAAAAMAAAAAAAEPAAGGSSGISCVQVLAFVQLVLGMLLPAFVMYHLEAHKRWSWWRNKQRHMAQRGSSSSGSLRSPAATAARGDVPATSTASLATLEAAAVAALTAAGWDLGPSACKTRPAGEAAAGKAKGVDVVRTDGSSSSSNSSCCSSNASCSSSGSNGGGINAATSSCCVGSSNGSLQSQLSLSGLSARQDQALGHAAATSSTAAAAAAAAAGPVCGVDEASLLAAVDAFDQTDHSCSNFAPPGLADVFVLVVVVGVSWLLLGQVL